MGICQTKALCKGFQKGFYPFAIGQAGNRDYVLRLCNSLLAVGGLRGPIWTGPLMFFASFLSIKKGCACTA